MNEILAFFAQPLVLGGIGSVVTVVVGWLIARSTAVQTDATNVRRDGMQERATAFTEVMAVVKTLREDIADLRKELEQERVIRRAAERTVRALLEEVSRLRKLLQISGMVPPPLPDDAIAELETEFLKPDSEG